MSREQTAGMSIGPAAQQQQIEDGQLDAIPRGEAVHEELLVLIGQLLDVIQLRDVDGVHDGLAHVGGDLVEQLGLQEAVVGVGVVEGHGALVGEEDLPLVELDRVFGGAGRGQERLGQGLGQRAARHGDLEDLMSLNAGILTLHYVCSQTGREGVDGREGE